MVRSVLTGSFDRSSMRLLPTWATVYDPEEAMPDEIAQAKIDEFCPRCGRRMDQSGQAGSCRCGFAY